MSAKQPKWQNSCSKMWPIEQLYIELGLCPPWKCSSRKAELKLRAFSKGLKNIEPEKSDRFSDLSSSFSPWALAVHKSQKRPNFVWWPSLHIKDKSPGPGGENQTIIVSNYYSCWAWISVGHVLLSLTTCSLYHEKLFILKFKVISSQVLNNFFSASDIMEAVRGRFCFYGMNAT